jgi:Asp-tRNA(Asn)/Glu-tRNA(Gln) amidotransferase A subunit family amidase
VPCGFVDGLPVGLAIAGPPAADAAVLRVAAAFQTATDWHERRPDPALWGVPTVAS